MPNSIRIVTFGDSVPWGQGLPEGDKFDSLLRDHLRSLGHTVDLERRAHSGAVIGFHPTSGGPAPGEVPVARPTVAEQVAAFNLSPETVDIVIVNGGINDVGVATILNPFSILPPLGARIESACHDRMLALLNQLRPVFSKPTCRILVTGYYTILSDQSDPLNVPGFLRMFGIAAPQLPAGEIFLDPIVDRCRKFFDESTIHLQAAVAETGDPRIRFVPSGFTDANAVFVPGTSLLWGLDLLLNPVDPLAGQRRPQCDLTFPNPLDLLHREQCHRASAGHPNILGARQYKNQLLAALA